MSGFKLSYLWALIFALCYFGLRYTQELSTDTKFLADLIYWGVMALFVQGTENKN